MTIPRKGNGNHATKKILLLLTAPFALAVVGLGVVSVFQPLAWQRLKNHVGSEVERYRCEFDPVCITANKEQELGKRARVKTGEFMANLNAPPPAQSSQPVSEREESSENDNYPSPSAGEAWVESNRFPAYARCVEDLKNNLRDPDSYKEDNWDVVSGRIFIKYRAKNGFGGMNRGVRICAFDSSGDITSRI
jgi:hypothetical protein